MGEVTEVHNISKSNKYTKFEIATRKYRKKKEMLLCKKKNIKTSVWEEEW